MTTESKLTHLEHPEDRLITGGQEGFHHSLHDLDAVHEQLSGHKNKAHLATKYDGAPSLVFGHHPESGKFFVATKSAFNKTPKLNYTHADIVKNHEAGGLREKLHTALKHLPKVAPKTGVFQGDVMYSHHDVAHDDKSYHFKPNTITYSAGKHSEEGKKIGKAKMGLVVHTHYRGLTNKLEDMKATHYHGILSHFGSHPDVHLVDPHYDTSKAHYTPEAQKEYHHHMREAMRHVNKLGDVGHAVIAQHKEHLQRYVNDVVRTRSHPDAGKFQNFVEQIHNKKLGELKTASKRKEHSFKSVADLTHIHANKEHFEHLFAAHGHLQAAKGVLMHAMHGHTTFHHSINGKPSQPEGYVLSHAGRTTKLVDRKEFSHANLQKREFGK